MSTWQLTTMIVTLGLLMVMALAGGFLAYHLRERKRSFQKRAAAVAKAAAEQAAKEQAAKERTAAIQAHGARVAAGRLAAKRAGLEKAALEKTAREKMAVEQAISEWAAAEQAEAERANLHKTSAERREAEAMEFRLRAVEDAIAEWVDAEQHGSRVAAAPPGRPARKKAYSRTDAVHQQVRSTAEAVAKEIQELEFIKNRIEAGVDFLPIEFKQTIDEWKQGRVLRHSSFDDIKLKFRYKAYSVEDGYELLYMYERWINQQRQKLRVFIRLLGTVVESSESIQAAIERAERNEREKYLEMDVDVIFTLREIRDILDRLFGMETVLQALEVVCRRRSEQIIAPAWEAKGSL